MAISYVGGVQGGRAGATTTTTQSLSGTLTGGSDTSPATGDLVVVWCSSGGDGTGAPTNQAVSGNNSGAYTTEAFQSITTATYDSFSQLNYFRQGGTVDTSLTIPSSGNARNAQRWVIHVFRGVDSVTPIDTASQAASGTATGRPNPAAITPATAGAWILGLYASAAATGTAYTAPTDFATDWLGGTTVDTADCMQGAGYYTGWTSGAYDPAAITAGGTTNAADSWTARTVALRPQGAVTHATTGALTGSGATVVGSATRFRAHQTDGSLTGQGSSITGGANRFRAFDTSGTLTGPDAVLDGAADHSSPPSFVTHDTTGTLTGQGAVVVGSAVKIPNHQTIGVLAGQIATVNGSATRFRAHDTSGAPTGQIGSAAGVAQRNAAHGASGTLAGSGSGIAGSAKRFHAFAATGALAGQGSVLDGAANHSTGPVSHATSCVLTGAGAIIVGSAARFHALDSSGALAGQSATLEGTASRTRVHECSGSIVGQLGSLDGVAQRTRVHEVTGELVADGAILVGMAANDSAAIQISFTEATISALAAAVWATQLPLGSAPQVSYGAQTLSATELEAISYAVWAKTPP